MLQYILITTVVLTLIFIFWLITSAKRSMVIIIDEAQTLWKIHKKNDGCKAKKWQAIKRNGEKVKGFKCECGYKFIQKKPLVTEKLKTL